jgi:hypothetical protein
MGGAAVGFRNELKGAVVVQGFTFINGMKKSGQAILILPGKIGTETNVPAGIRYYTISDPNGTQVYLNNVPVPVQNNDLALAIRVGQNGFKLEPAR